MTLDVDAAAPGSSCQLGVLPRAESHMGRPVPLAQGFQDDSTCRHVDAERQGLSRVDNLDQSGAEQLLNGLLEDGEEAGVVGGHASLQGVHPVAEAQHSQVSRRNLGRTPLNDLANPSRFGLGCQIDSGIHGLVDSLLAAGTGEDEYDCREEIGLLECCDDGDP